MWNKTDHKPGKSFHKIYLNENMNLICPDFKSPLTWSSWSKSFDMKVNLISLLHSFVSSHPSQFLISIRLKDLMKEVEGKARFVIIGVHYFHSFKLLLQAAIRIINYKANISGTMLNEQNPLII